MDKPSNRQKRKRVAAGVRALKSRPGWDPANHVSETPQDALARLDQESRSERVYGEGDACDACAEARGASGDDSALCDAHLAAAMGF